ncbi:TadE family type IV pilus minor pilin [Planctomonas psychrotolerans]|uniref:TadE family type IV pilus minor pilin n=1 Tax=Planctomonas psychrotolerans TaxID=2528712 RepID=UPI00123C303D|nr:TadE family type IV pilus minor pilin [Planctomonas psychrotolerans]
MRSSVAHGSATGSVTAEFAAVLPAAIVVVVLCLAGFSTVGAQVRLLDAAADVARLVARGDSARATDYLARTGDRVAVRIDSRDDIVCVQLSTRAWQGPAGILPVDLSASSCAVGSGP